LHIAQLKKYASNAQMQTQINTKSVKVAICEICAFCTLNCAWRISQLCLCRH